MKERKFKQSNSNTRFLKLFLEKGSFHGLPFVAKEKLTIVEKVLWFILTSIAFALSIQLALQSLERFKTKSTVITIERDHYYWNTTLPSITICPMERLSYDKFHAHYKFHNMTAREKLELFDFLESLANATFFNFIDIKTYSSISKHNIDPMDYMYLIYNLTENYLESPNGRTRFVAKADDWYINCQQILTEWGICYSTNNHLLDELSTGNLLFGKKPHKNPYEATENVHKTFSVNLFDSDIPFTFMGIKGRPIVIYIHGAYEMMTFNRIDTFTSSACEYEVQIYDITSSDGFGKSTTPEQRHCRFPHESNLDHFPTYTRDLCYQECRINLAYKLCKCIPHFYPNRVALKRVCHYNELKNCLSKYTRIFENLNDIKNLSSDIGDFKCNCLQSCRSSNVLEKKRKELSGIEDIMLTNGVYILLKEYPTLRYRRQIIFTLTDLLVSIGGTVGFFLGSSFLSAVEIIYYFTVRLIWHYYGFNE